MRRGRGNEGYDGGGSALGRLFSSWRQPAVKHTEQVNIETQWTIPRDKSLKGVGGFSLLFLLSFCVFVVTVPPAMVPEAVYLILLGGLFVSGVLGVLFWLEPKRSAIYPLMVACGMAGTLLVTQSMALESDWWFGNWIEPSVLFFLRCIPIAGMLSGGFGTYWFGKELVVMYELTGLDRVVEQYARFSMKMEAEDWVSSSEHEEVLGELEDSLLAASSLESERDRLQGENAELIKLAGSRMARPLVAGATHADQLREAFASHHISLLEFLIVALVHYQSFSRRKWTRVNDRREDATIPPHTVLPCGLPVNDAEWRQLTGVLSDPRTGPILVDHGSGTGKELNPNMNVLQVLEVLWHVREELPPKLKPEP